MTDPRLENSPGAFVEFSDDGVITFSNGTLARWLGRTPSELLGQKFESILTLPNRIFFQTHFFPLLKLQGQASEIFLSLLKRDGSFVPVVASAEHKNSLCSCVFLTVTNRERYEAEIVKARRAAEEALRNNGELQLAKEENAQRTQDLDHRLRELQNRNSELTYVSQVLSHDLREPMRKVRLFADLVRSSTGSVLDGDAEAGIQKIFSESDRAIALIASIQRYLDAGNTREAIGKVDLRLVCAAAARNVEQSTLDWRVEVESLPEVEGRARELQILFEELFQNAVKFREPSRPLKVTVHGYIIQQNSYQQTQDRYNYRNFLQIDISDNGKGFDPYYRNYVFNLLKKVDLTSPGFGVGLAICRKIAESHFGTIEIMPAVGTGATIVLRLPVLQ